MLVVVGLQIFMRYLGLREKFAFVEEGILNFALLGNGILVARLIARVEGLQFFVGGMQTLANVILREEGVLELYLRVALLEFLTDIAVGNRSAARNQGREFALENFVLDVLLKASHRQIVLGQKILVGLLADEL